MTGRDLRRCPIHHAPRSPPCRRTRMTKTLLPTSRTEALRKIQQISLFDMSKEVGSRTGDRIMLLEARFQRSAGAHRNFAATGRPQSLIALTRGLGTTNPCSRRGQSLAGTTTERLEGHCGAARGTTATNPQDEQAGSAQLLSAALG